MEPKERYKPKDSKKFPQDVKHWLIFKWIQTRIPKLNLQGCKTGLNGFSRKLQFVMLLSLFTITWTWFITLKNMCFLLSYSHNCFHLYFNVYPLYRQWICTTTVSQTQTTTVGLATAVSYWWQTCCFVFLCFFPYPPFFLSHWAQSLILSSHTSFIPRHQFQVSISTSAYCHHQSTISSHSNFHSPSSFVLFFSPCLRALTLCNLTFRYRLSNPTSKLLG